MSDDKRFISEDSPDVVSMHGASELDDTDLLILNTLIRTGIKGVAEDAQRVEYLKRLEALSVKVRQAGLLLHEALNEPGREKLL